MSHKSQRLTWRARCRRWQRYINYLLAVLAVAVLLPAQASAAPRCPGGTPTPQGCIYQPDPRTVCAWPYRLVRVGHVALCIRQAGEVQP